MRTEPVSDNPVFQDVARLLVDDRAAGGANLFRTQGLGMVLANVERTASSALPACHERSSVLTVESVVR